MTERDFDNIFKDKIGDELPYDFRPSDWLAAEQELDKLMPLAAPTVPIPPIAEPPVMRLLTWHKWAAAAAVLLLGSQLYLMTQLGKVTNEVVALRQEKTELKASDKAGISVENKTQGIVIQHDTVIKTVYIEVPQNGKSSEQFSQEKKASKQVNSKRFDQFEGSNGSLNESNEAIGMNLKTQGTAPSKMNMATKNTGLNAEKMALNSVENTSKINAQKEQILNNKNELNKSDLINSNKENKDNLLVINKENTDNLIDNNNKINSTELLNKENTPNLTDIKKEMTVLNALPNADLATVKSINRAKNWLNDEIFDFILKAKPVIIKPMSEPNGWEITANSLLLATEEHRRPRVRGNFGDHDEQRMSFGGNIRVGYNLNTKLRLSAEADFWNERHGRDTTGRPQILPQDFKLTTVEQTFTAFQLRIGADYKTRQIFGLQPFVGIGLAYQKRSNDDFQFRYKKDNKPLPPISVPNEAKFEKPVFVSLRAGIEGKIYRRLGWSIDVNAQRGATNRQAFMSHLGVKYAF
jgi:Outer membrane protein beta-barrel domain